MESSRIFAIPTLFIALLCSFLLVLATPSTVFATDDEPPQLEFTGDDGWLRQPAVQAGETCAYISWNCTVGPATTTTTTSFRNKSCAGNPTNCPPTPPPGC